MICDICGEAINYTSDKSRDPGNLLWDDGSLGTGQFRVAIAHKRCTPAADRRYILEVREGNGCYQWPFSWELRDFMNPEGFCRWVNDRLRNLGPNYQAMLELLDKTWPSVLRKPTEKEAAQCDDALKFGLWYGKKATK